MPAPHIVDWTTIDIPGDLRFAANPTKSMSHDGHSVYVNVIDKKLQREVPFYHQGPPMMMTFGIVPKETPQGVSYKFSLSFPTLRYNPVNDTWTGEEKYVKYYQFLKSIDTYNKKHVCENSELLFGKNYKQEIVDEFYISNTWESDKCRSGEYSPTVSVKIMTTKTGEFQTTFFSNRKRADGELEEITFEPNSEGTWKGLKCVPIIKTTGLWFAGKQFGMSLQVEQMVVFFRDKFIGCAVDITGLEDIIELSADTMESDAAAGPFLTPSPNPKRQRLIQTEEGEDASDTNDNETQPPLIRTGTIMLPNVAAVHNFNMPALAGVSLMSRT